jgi:xylulokinase
MEPSTMDTPVSLGIDLGTSELKAVLTDATGVVLGSAGKALSVSRPYPGWSEQEPEDWWRACVSALNQLRHEHSAAYACVGCVGIAGQMHAAVLLDRTDKPIRPAILWNDSRALREAEMLAQLDPSFSTVSGSLPMAGFTAPKILWVRDHEPEVFARIDCLLSAKDFLRLKLTGNRQTDVTDASGTGWMDVRERRWFEPIVRATGLEIRHLPPVLESSSASGELVASAAEVLGLRAGLIVAAGAGDNPAAGVGVGATETGHSLVSLGTSAAVLSITERFIDRGSPSVHRYCHALPNRWYAMGAILSGASALRWISRVLSQPSEQVLLESVAREIPHDRPVALSAPIFLPYLAGERTPHNDPLVRAGFVNLGHDTSAAMLGYAVLEGVGFALRDALAAVESTGAVIADSWLVGGGARSTYWAQLLSDVLGCTLQLPSGSDLSAAVGAAKLAFLAQGQGTSSLRTSLAIAATFKPRESHRAALDARYERFRSLFPAVHSLHE